MNAVKGQIEYTRPEGRKLMRAVPVLLVAVAGFLALASCASGPASGFPIARGPLTAGEMARINYGQTLLSAQVFDVVNQDQTAAGQTGIAGKVDPLPAGILSAYAARKFRATGGPYAVRFVIKRAAFQARALPQRDEGGFFGFMHDDPGKVELSADISVMVVASLPGGAGATISATTIQKRETNAGGSPEDNRAAYLDLMGKAVAALDGEISRQLPVYFGLVLSR